MRLHERLNRVAGLAEAMGLPGAAREIRDYARGSGIVDVDMRWFRAVVPASRDVSWQISWGWRDRFGMVSRRIEVGPEF